MFPLYRMLVIVFLMYLIMAVLRLHVAQCAHASESYMSKNDLSYIWSLSFVQ